MSWEQAMRRAKSACDEAGFTRDAAASRRFVYDVDFTISRELVDVLDLDIGMTGDGCRVHMRFAGSEEAKRQVLDVVSALPSTARTYRMTYELEGVRA